MNSVLNKDTLLEYPLVDMQYVEQGRDLMGEAYEQMVAFLMEDAAAHVKSMCEALESNNFSEVAQPAHTMKSSAKQLGAVQLSELSKRIEACAKQVDEMPSLQEELVKDIVALVDVLEATWLAYRDIGVEVEKGNWVD